MEIFGLNLLGIFVCTFIGMALGGLWYSPILFGKAWVKCIGKTPETIGTPTIPMIGSIVASFLTAIGVSLISAFMMVDSLVMGIEAGLIIGLFIVLPALLSDNLFCGWGLQLFFIQSGYRTLSILLMSIALVYIT